MENTEITTTTVRPSTDAASAAGSGLPTYDHRAGTGPTLVLLHYWGGSARTWDAVVDRLPGRDVLALDLRGWGRSQHLPGPYSLHQLAADVLGVIAEAGVREHVLVGHSMGGKVAQLVAAGRPAGLLGLVLVAPGPARPAAMISSEYQAQLAHAYDTDQSIAGVRDHVLTGTPLPEELKLQVLADSRASGAEARDEWPLRGIAEDVSGLTPAIDVPTLVVGGDHDHVEPVEVLRDNLLPYVPDARLEVLPSGHLIPLEAPAALAGLIDGFAPLLP
ncbi:alpha/beta fold hydrolase [Cellulomonas sp. SG140]|uniref:alpha/beta fold hydrolase n=1 Tax=Cellulomonas sp. SG140 TaxID=2976536 RepID=UPI0021E73F10|nr:alpha/beta hydrolase [Cellulomonas sp. SG140]